MQSPRAPVLAPAPAAPVLAPALIRNTKPFDIYNKKNINQNPRIPEPAAPPVPAAAGSGGPDNGNNPNLQVQNIPKLQVQNPNGSPRRPHQAEGEIEA